MRMVQWSISIACPLFVTLDHETTEEPRSRDSMLDVFAALQVE